MSELTDEGRAYAAAHAKESLVANVALQADLGETTWPEPFQTAAIQLCNEEGESE